MEALTSARFTIIDGVPVMVGCKIETISEQSTIEFLKRLRAHLNGHADEP